MKYKYYLVVLLLCKGVFSFSQAVPRGTELQELLKITEVYKNAPSLSFDLKYTFADSLTWTDLTDSMFASCKLGYGKSFISNSDFESLSGFEYNVTVDKEDSFIYAMRRSSEESILQAPLMDPVFRKAHVDSMRVDVINDSTWQFLAFFKTESFYSYYEMNYDPGTGFIKRINYHGRNDPGAHDIPADHIVCATIYLTNYSEATIDPVTFNESRYFYKLNGTLYLQTAWQDFQFENY